MAENSNALIHELKTNIVDRFYELLSSANITALPQFDTICAILDNIVNKIAVSKDKSDRETYDKGKKSFAKFLAYNYDFLKSTVDLSEYDIPNDDFFDLFKTSSNKNWNNLHVIVLSYLSYQKQTKQVIDNVNYKGMIEKIMLKLEQFETFNEQLDNQTADIDTLKNTEDTQMIAKNILSDINAMFTASDNIDMFEIGKQLTDKYQTMLSQGELNVENLLEGVMNILSDPTMINQQFGDQSFDNLNIDPENMMNAMSNNPMFGNMMSMMEQMSDNSGGDASNMISSMMSAFFENNNETDPEEPQTVQELELAIEQLMNDMMNKNNADPNVDPNVDPNADSNVD